MSYPYLPWDNKLVREVRRAIQKPYQQEELLAWLVYRRMSIYLSLWLARKKLQVAYFFDLLDGEVARLRKQFSTLGCWLDRVLEGGMVAATASIGAKGFLLYGVPPLVGAWLAVVFLRAFARFAFVEEMGKSLPTTHVRVQNPLINVGSFLGGPNGFVLLLLLLHASGLKALFLVPYALFLLATAAQVWLLWRSVHALEVDKK